MEVFYRNIFWMIAQDTGYIHLWTVACRTLRVGASLCSVVATALTTAVVPAWADGTPPPLPDAAAIVAAALPACAAGDRSGGGRAETPVIPRFSRDTSPVPPTRPPAHPPTRFPRTAGAARAADCAWGPAAPAVGGTSFRGAPPAAGDTANTTGDNSVVLRSETPPNRPFSEPATEPVADTRLAEAAAPQTFVWNWDWNCDPAFRAARPAARAGRTTVIVWNWHWSCNGARRRPPRSPASPSASLATSPSRCGSRAPATPAMSCSRSAPPRRPPSKASRQPRRLRRRSRRAAVELPALPVAPDAAPAAPVPALPVESAPTELPPRRPRRTRLAEAHRLPTVLRPDGTSRSPRVVLPRQASLRRAVSRRAARRPPLRSSAQRLRLRTPGPRVPPRRRARAHRFPVPSSPVPSDPVPAVLSVGQLSGHGGGSNAERRADDDDARGPSPCLPVSRPVDRPTSTPSRACHSATPAWLTPRGSAQTAAAVGAPQPMEPRTGGNQCASCYSRSSW